MLPFTRSLLATLLLACPGCDVYDDDLTYSNPGVDSGSQVMLDACTPSAESCNGKDDDCDGDVDEEAASTMYCEQKFNALSACETGFCVKTGACHVGFYNCDGKPENGCESLCPCSGCEDAGPDAS